MKAQEQDPGIEYNHHPCQTTFQKKMKIFGEVKAGPEI